MLNSSTNKFSMPPISVFSRCPNLGYIKEYLSIPSNSPTLVVTVLFPRDPTLPIVPMYSQKTYIQLLAFILTSASSTISPAKTLPHTPPLLMIPQVTSLDIPLDQIFHHHNSSKNSFSSPATMTTIYTSCGLMKVDNFPDHKTPCNSTLTMQLLLIPLGVMPPQ